MNRHSAEGVRVDTKKPDVSRCMVRGCNGAAIYRNWRTSTYQGCVRGYCSAHKSLAVGKYSRKTQESFSDWVLRGTE